MRDKVKTYVIERKMSNENLKYEVSIDLIKIIACGLIVALHTINGNLGMLNYFISQSGIIAVPLFFMVNGYLLFRKLEINYKYIIRKIWNILKICFFWEFAHACAHFLYYREIRNFISSFFYDFFQKGLFYHFWFFGALIIIYFITPVIRKIEKNNPIIFLIILIVLCIICVGVHSVQLFIKERFIMEIIQTFRIWVWLFYFMAGGWISTHKEIFLKVNEIPSVIKILFVILSLASLIIWARSIGELFFNSIYMNEASHGSFMVILTTIAIFILFSHLNINESKVIYIKKMADMTMGIYIFHPFLLAVLVKFFPIVKELGWANIMYWMCTILISALGTRMISKIPVLNKMIKL